MSNPFGVPEMSVHEVARKRDAGEQFLLVDVREQHELRLANLGAGVIHVPLSQLARQRQEALPEELMQQDAEIVIMCHHGNRSAQVAAWLMGQGWTNVWNMTGGIDAYAREIAPSIGFY